MSYLEYLIVAAACAIAWAAVCHYRKIKLDGISGALLVSLSMAWLIVLPCVLGWNLLHWVPSKIKDLFEPEDHQ
jgi:nucleoside permease NupC